MNPKRHAATVKPMHRSAFSTSRMRTPGPLPDLENWIPSPRIGRRAPREALRTWLLAFADALDARARRPGASARRGRVRRCSAGSTARSPRSGRIASCRRRARDGPTPPRRAAPRRGPAERGGAAAPTAYPAGPMRRLLPLLALLATAVLLTACGGDATDDRPNADATLMLDFTPNAAHAGIYSAVAHGFDDAEGVHLRVRVPGSSTDAVKLLLSGRTQFSVMDIHDLALAVREAATSSPSCRSCSGRSPRSSRRPTSRARATSPAARSASPACRATTPSSDRSSPAPAATPTPSRRSRSASTRFPRCSAAESPARPPSGTSRASRSEASAPACTTSASTPTARRPTPSSCWSRRAARLREDPALVNATVRALVRGYGVTVHDPASSLHDLESRVRGLDARQLQAQLDVLIPALSPPGGRIGGLDPQILARWARWEARFGIVSAAARRETPVRHAGRAGLRRRQRRRGLTASPSSRACLAHQQAVRAALRHAPHEPGRDDPQHRREPVRRAGRSARPPARAGVDDRLGDTLAGFDTAQPVARRSTSIVCGKPSVATKPGSTSPTWTPCGCSSRCSESVQPANANLLAE